jgi:hypothetical protein
VSGVRCQGEMRQLRKVKRKAEKTEIKIKIYFFIRRDEENMKRKS